MHIYLSNVHEIRTNAYQGQPFVGKSVQFKRNVRATLDDAHNQAILFEELAQAGAGLDGTHYGREI
jgi:hypothetical protein